MRASRQVFYCFVFEDSFIYLERISAHPAMYRAQRTKKTSNPARFPEYSGGIDKYDSWNIEMMY